jgi:phosphoribosylformylglycinamidine (FGAM) synthase PurS component
MFCVNIQHKTHFIYDSYVKSFLVRAFCRKSKRKFPGVDIPAGSAIHSLVNKLKTTRSILDDKMKIRRHVLTEEKLEDADARVEHLTRKLLKN